MFQSIVIANESVIVIVTGKKPSDKAESKGFFLGKKKKTSTIWQPLTTRLVSQTYIDSWPNKT